MKNPFQVVKDFEAALCDYTGAPYAVTTSSCTMALLLAVAWHLRGMGTYPGRHSIEIPKRTYVSVPMSIIHAGGRPVFRDDDWHGAYRLEPLPVWDCARRFARHMYTMAVEAVDHRSVMLCTSFHWSKILGIQQGGAILHDDAKADAWLRRARFDGRAEGVAPKDDVFTFAGWHAYMSPEIAAAGLVRLPIIGAGGDLPNDDYPDLSQMEIFK